MEPHFIIADIFFKYQFIRYGLDSEINEIIHQYKGIMKYTQQIFFFIWLKKKKKSDLKNLRQEKLQGCYIRSKMQWAEEGEKPSIFFINLENIFFTNKTIPKLVNESGNVVTDQNQIL